jgi:hypothetical protein
MKATLFVSIAVWLGAQAGALGQLPTGGGIGLNAALLQLFGNYTAFSTRVEMRMLDQSRKETLSLSMDLARLNQMLRADVDMSNVKSEELGPQTVAQLKQMGIDQVTSIMRPDKASTCVVYPKLQAYTEVPMPPDELADFRKRLDVSKASLGKETVAGHPCQKAKVVVLGDKGQRHEAVVWYASDLKDFPVQIQMDQKEASVVMTCRNIRLAPPDPKLFEPPAAGFTKYATTEQIMQAGMMRMMAK